MIKIPIYRLFKKNLQNVQEPVDLNHTIQNTSQYKAKLMDLFKQIGDKIPYSDINNTILYGGNPKSKIMAVGEAPGADEVTHGEPFVGRSGKLLQAMFDCAGLLRKNIYITNVIPWRPPMNRPPMPEEIKVARPVLYEHIKIIKPKILILVGGIAHKTFTDSKDPILKIRGKWFTNENYPDIKIITILHPSFLLRVPHNKKHAWNDIISIAKMAHQLGMYIEPQNLIL